MMPRSISVSIDLAAGTTPVGTIWPHQGRTRGSGAATFEYGAGWLADPARFALEPALTLGRGKFQTGAGRPLFGAFSDSAPDRWGRTLMQRAAAERARAEHRPPQALSEADYLLGVSDDARVGALRFATSVDGPFLAVPGPNTVPPLVELPALLHASDDLLRDESDSTALRLLLAPGSSLGGTRPKASVRDRHGHLAIAKFPSSTDTLSVVRWEAVALALAERAGLRVEEWRLEQVVDRPVLIVRRFDRRGGARIPFLSAMTMLGAGDHETHSYLEIADAIRQHGAATGEDLRELWRRIVFTILISNTDDHLRNHGFLYDEPRRGWRLAPLYDVNPVPRTVRPRILTLAIDEVDTTASIELALEVASYFDIERADAGAIVERVREAVSEWPEQARAAGLTRSDIADMQSAFGEAP